MKTYTFRSLDGLMTYVGAFVNDAHAMSHALWLAERHPSIMVTCDGVVVAFTS